MTTEPTDDVAGIIEEEVLFNFASLFPERERAVKAAARRVAIRSSRRLAQSALDLDALKAAVDREIDKCHVAEAGWIIGAGFLKQRVRAVFDEWGKR